jgi:hypothetical protein
MASALTAKGLESLAAKQDCVLEVDSLQVMGLAHAIPAMDAVP